METPPAADEIPVFQAPAPAPPPVHPRRRNALWYAALLVALVVTLGGFGLLYWDDVSWQHQAADLKGQNATLHQQLLTAQAGLTTAEGTIQELRNEAKHPNLGIWNVQQHIDGPDYYLAGGVPDTFTYHLVASSSGPMSVSILTFEQFASAVDCVHTGTGNTHYCMNHQPGTFKTWDNVTEVNYDFHQAEGCANYLVVFTSGERVTVTPNVSVTYNPAPTFTGDC
ncbi:MAG TPA: hypothetical protein VI384_05855 [Candidatus Dormibacteraeota bacterium]